MGDSEGGVEWKDVLIQYALWLLLGDPLTLSWHWRSSEERSFQIPKHPSVITRFACELWTSRHQHWPVPIMSSCWKPTLTSMTASSSTVTGLQPDRHGTQGDVTQESYGQPGSGCSACPTLGKQPCSDSRDKALAWIPQTKAGCYQQGEEVCTALQVA